MRKLHCLLVVLLSVLSTQVLALQDGYPATAELEPSEQSLGLDIVTEGDSASVDVWGVHLVTIRSYYRNFSPRQRAQHTVQQISAIPIAR